MGLPSARRAREEVVGLGLLRCGVQGVRVVKARVPYRPRTHVRPPRPPSVGICIISRQVVPVGPENTVRRLRREATINDQDPKLEIPGGTIGGSE